MMEVKGGAIKDTPEFIKENFGEDAYHAWLDSLSDASKKIFTSQILVSAWYPIEPADIEPNKKIIELFYRGDPRGAKEVGRYAADKILTGIYKAFVKLGSPSFIISKASAIMVTFYKPSKLEIKEKSEKHVIVRITEFEQMTEILEYNFAGFMERALEICGCKNVEIKIITSLAKGGPYSEFESTWQ
ncbi:hypothetical protein ACFLZ9_00490 [Patescibacteria group bacterium]